MAPPPGFEPGAFPLQQSDTYRAVYTVKLSVAIYVLHCFQKKSTKGIVTPKPDMDKIRDRLKLAEQHAKGETS